MVGKFITMQRLSGIFAVILMAGTGMVDAAAQTIPTKLVRPDEINKQLSRTGSVRVIIYTSSDAEVRDLERQVGSKYERETAKATIRDRVDPVVKSYYPGGKSSRGTDVKTFGLLPAFASEVTPSDLKRLQDDPRVHKIQIDELKTINLNSSVPLMGLPSGGSSPDTEPTGNGRTIAVIDTGVQANHPFIGSSRVVAEACFLSTAKCPNGSTAQVGPGASAPASGSGNWHGTHVSGIALGHYAAGASVNRGVASKANLVMVNVFGSQSGAYTSDIIRALEFIDSLKTTGSGTYTQPISTIDSINMSLGGGNYATNCDSDPEKAPIDSLRAHGVATVIAAGNDGSTTMMSSPGCISSAISVAATSKTSLAIASYTNLSSVTTLFAPGGELSNCIVSSVPGSTYSTMCGTSMATPHVAGVVALLRQANPNATVDAIVAAITNNMASVQDTRTGSGFTKPFLSVPTAIANLQNLKLNNFAISSVGGTVSSSSGSMSCLDGVCTGAFLAGSDVTLTAAPDAQSTFASWSISAAPSCTTSATCTFQVPDATSLSGTANFASAIVDLKASLDLPGGSPLVFTSPDSHSWVGLAVPAISNDGVDAARSANITDNQTSSLQTTVTGPGTLTFKWAVSSESGYDYLRFYVDGVRQSAQISGSTSYSSNSYSISCGSHTVKWAYEKDYSVSDGNDAGYLDQMAFTSTGSCPSVQTLSVSLSNMSFGTVTSSPSGIRCGTSYSSCSASFANSTSVTLTAMAVSRRKFTGWSGACNGTSRTCRVTMTAAKSVTANFR